MCHCGNEQGFELCCEPIINGNKIAESPEELMRSRYTAYKLGNAHYIYNTYAEEKRSENPVAAIKDFSNSCRFLNLEILNTNNKNDTVEFKVNYLYQNHLCTLHEVSTFVVEQSQWRYLHGLITEVPEIKIGRNDDCPCGSNKKYKKCHAL